MVRATHLDSVERCHAHVEEHAVEHGHGDELEHNRHNLTDPGHDLHDVLSVYDSELSASHLKFVISKAQGVILTVIINNIKLMCLVFAGIWQ